MMLLLLECLLLTTFSCVAGITNTTTVTPPTTLGDTTPDDTTLAYLTEQRGDDEWTTKRPTVVDERTPLYLAGLFSMDGIWDGSGVYVGADLALKHVDENPDILQGYKLMMTLSNSQCNDGVGIQKLFQQIFEDPQKLLIIGPGCSTSAQAIASTAHFWNLNVMSPTASSPALSSRNKYPTFFRIIPSETLQTPSRVKLIKLHNWTRVATIHQNHQLFSLTTDDLLTELRENNITVISSESFDEYPANQVENLKKQDAKIIISNMYAYLMRRVMCEAYKQEMYGDDYVWFIVGWYNEGWYLEEDDQVDCTMEEMAIAVESMIYISTLPQLIGGDDDTTIAGIKTVEYKALLADHIKQDRLSGYTLIDQAAYGYDAIWSVALALNQSVGILRTMEFEDGQTRGLENFTYSDKEMSTVIFNALESLDFVGVSGPVSFSGSDRIGTINVMQLRGHCPEEWFLSGRYCYQFVTSKDTMSAAVSMCEDEGSSLLSVLTESENSALVEAVERQMNNVDKWWLSLKVSSSGGPPSWSSGPHEELGWTPWSGSDTSSHPAGSCFVFDSKSGSWLPEFCEMKHGFICKKLAVFRQVTIADHDIARDRFDWFDVIGWPGGKVPLDHTPQVVFTTVEVHETIPPPIYLVVCSMATLGLLLAIVCLVFNTYFRNQRFIKMSSPNLNSLIIIGCMLIYVSECMAGWDIPFIDEAFFLRLCQVRVWLFSIGFVLSFGSMFSKTWRVHKIAALKTPKRVIITDHHLFILVAILLLVEVMILSSWFVVNPMYIERENLHKVEDLDNLVITQLYIQYCTSGNILYWQGALYGYKALLLLFAVFLAWETRKVTIPALNDSKLIGLCVYNVVLLSAIGFGVNLALNTDPSVSFIFTSTIQIFCTTVTLVIIFIPKMVTVRKYPEGKVVTTMRSSVAVSSTDNQPTDEVINMGRKLQSLEATGGSHTGCGCWCGGNVCACGQCKIEARTAYTVESTDTAATVS